MRAVILAAGRGSRMKDLTEAAPKCLVQVRGKALLDWQLDAFHAAGVSDIAIVTGYRRELLAGRAPVQFHNPRWAETNMVSSLACARDWLVAGPCLVSYSDIFFDAQALGALMASDAALAISYDANWLALWTRRFGDPLLDAETFRLHADGTLAEIGNKPRSVDEVQGQYMGLLRFTPAAWAEVERIRAGLSAAERDRMHMTGTLQKVVEAGRLPVSALAYGAEWGEVDCEADLAAYQDGAA